MPRARLVLAVIAAAAAVGTCLPWATFRFAYAGRMSTPGPQGARGYVLILAVGVILAALVPAVWSRATGLWLGVFGAAVAITNFVGIAIGGGGLGAVAPGAWLSSLGLLAAAALCWRTTLGADTRTPLRGRLVAPAAIIATVVAITSAIVHVLGIGDPGPGASALSARLQLISALVAVVGVGVAAASSGYSAWLRSQTHSHQRLFVLAVAAALVAFPVTQGENSYWVRVFATVGIYTAAAVGLNIVVGLAGLLDLGYIAFLGIGAYVGGLLGNAGVSPFDVHLPFVLVIVIGTVVAAIFGVIIGAPTLRLRGDYLAIVTLGFGEIFRITAGNLTGLTGGPAGVSGIEDLNVAGYDFYDGRSLPFGLHIPNFASYFYLELVLVAVVLVVFARVDRSRIGRAWVAIREDETAAEAMGIDTTRMKLLAFALGAALAGAAGTVSAHVGHQVSPDSFTFLESVMLLAAVVLGGMGTIPGAALGVTALFVLPEKFRVFQDYRLLLFGTALVVMMRFRPQGIVTRAQRARELAR